MKSAAGPGNECSFRSFQGGVDVDAILNQQPKYITN